MDQQHQNNALLDLRPIIDIEFNGEKTKEERFLHDVLRPILKFQHQTIKNLIEAEPHFSVSKILTKPPKDRTIYMKEFLQKNVGLKSQLLGVIIGLLTTDEQPFFFKHRTNLSKRINEMIIVRYLSIFS